MNFKQNSSIGFCIYRTATAVKREFSKRLSEFDTTPEQWTLLNSIYEQGSTTQKQLTDISFKDQANTARIIDKLAKKGLLIKLADRKDKRVTILRLTEYGYETRNKILPIAMEFNELLSANMSKEQQENFLEILDSIFNQLT